MRVPDGWQFVSEYCIRSECEQWTICRIGSADGVRYELWRLKEQVAVNLLTAEAAIETFHVEQAA
jgi:hypothetical protein